MVSLNDPPELPVYTPFSRSKLAFSHFANSFSNFVNLFSSVCRFFGEILKTNQSLSYENN